MKNHHDPASIEVFSAEQLANVSGAGKKSIGQAICNAAACAIIGEHDADGAQERARQQSLMQSQRNAIVRPARGAGGAAPSYGGFNALTAPSIGGGRGGSPTKLTSEDVTPLRRGR